MKAMILAAGRGTRLRPITDHTPKPMVPIAGKPLLEHTIRLLKRHNISEIAINLHHLPQVITDYFGDGARWGVKITYSMEKKLLGTAGAVKKLEGYFDGAFIIVYGDNFSNCDITRLREFHLAKGGICTIALFEIEDPRFSGIVRLEEDYRITEFIEKPEEDQIFTKLVNAGIYVVEPKIFKYIPEGREYDFGHDLFPQLTEEGEALYGYMMRERLIPLDTPESYRRAQAWIADCRLQIAE